MNVEHKQMIIKYGLIGLAGVIAVALVVRAVIPSGGGTAAVDRTPEEQATFLDSQKEQWMLAETGRRSVKQRADQCLRSIDQFDAELAAWQERIEPLLTDENGRFLAANRDYVNAFAREYNTERVAAAAAPAFRARLMPILQHANEALKNRDSIFKPDDQVYTELDVLKSEIADAIAPYQRGRKTIEGMLASAKRSAEPAAITLQEAMDRANEDFMAERIRRLSAAREEAERETTEELLGIQRRKDAEIREAQKAQLEIQLESQRKEIEAESIRKAAAAKQERLRTLASDEGIQKKFAPFLADGWWETGARGSKGMAPRDSEPGPISVRRLHRYNAVNDFESFVQVARGVTLGGMMGNANDRPPWPETPGDDKEAWDRLRADWQLFKELAPIWLKDGKLNP